jgi:hypothetical protein
MEHSVRVRDRLCEVFHRDNFNDANVSSVCETVSDMNIALAPKKVLGHAQRLQSDQARWTFLDGALRKRFIDTTRIDHDDIHDFCMMFTSSFYVECTAKLLLDARKLHDMPATLLFDLCNRMDDDQQAILMIERFKNYLEPNDCVDDLVKRYGGDESEVGRMLMPWLIGSGSSMMRGVEEELDDAEKMRREAIEEAERMERESQQRLDEEIAGLVKNIEKISMENLDQQKKIIAVATWQPTKEVVRLDVSVPVFCAEQSDTAVNLMGLPGGRFLTALMFEISSCGNPAIVVTSKSGDHYLQLYGNEITIEKGGEIIWDGKRQMSDLTHGDTQDYSCIGTVMYPMDNDDLRNTNQIPDFPQYNASNIRTKDVSEYEQKDIVDFSKPDVDDIKMVSVCHPVAVLLLGEKKIPIERSIGINRALLVRARFFEQAVKTILTRTVIENIRNYEHGGSESSSSMV